jgi:hypothetical protein
VVPKDDFADLVGQAFVYGYPLVADVSEVVRFTQSGMGSVPAAPLNQFSHARTLAGPRDTFVTINNDTLYSIAQLDLSGGPLLLDVPDAHGRYYVMQFIDAWTNNFAYVGKRASGTDASTWFLTPPGWSGEVPGGTTRVPVPTMVASILGRWACAGVDDLGAVHTLQDQLAIRVIDANSELAGVPTPDPSVPDELSFFERMRTWMRAFPPSAPDVSYQQRFQSLGVLDEVSPWSNMSPDDARPLVDALADAEAKLEAFTRTGTVQKINGWMLGLHMFDYNLDFFGPGTVDEPLWKKADRASAYPERALSARLGLWGNHGYEAAYAQTFEDDRGEQLDGSRRYSMTFQDLPPVAEFWSITMYDTPNYYLVGNPIDRYSIGDRTPGIVYADDGSLTISIQRDAPTDPTERANWLPAPERDFRPILRMYGPEQPILDGTYQLPPIKRLDP